MHYRGERVFGEQLVDARPIAQVEFAKLNLSPADRFQPVEHRRLAVVEIIDEDDFVAGFDESEGGMRADEAEAAGDENRVGQNEFPS